MRYLVYKRSLNDVINSVKIIMEMQNKIDEILNTCRKRNSSAVFFVDGMTQDIISDLENRIKKEYILIRKSIIKAIFNLL